MNFSIFSIRSFEKQLKRLVKKYPSLKGEFEALVTSLEKDPFQGTSIGNSCYKIRLAIASKAKGKSGGSRVITYLHIAEESLFLLSIYDKSEKSNITEKELKDLLANLEED
jgi:hypothetical protein